MQAPVELLVQLQHPGVGAVRDDDHARRVGEQPGFLGQQRVIALPAAFVEEHDVEAAPPQILQHREAGGDMVLVAGAQRRVARHEFEPDAALLPRRDRVGGGGDPLVEIDKPGVDIGHRHVMAGLRQRQRQPGVGRADAAVLEQPVKFGGDDADATFSVKRRLKHVKPRAADPNPFALLAQPGATAQRPGVSCRDRSNSSTASPPAAHGNARRDRRSGSGWARSPEKADRPSPRRGRGNSRRYGRQARTAPPAPAAAGISGASVRPSALVRVWAMRSRAPSASISNSSISTPAAGVPSTVSRTCVVNPAMRNPHRSSTV